MRQSMDKFTRMIMGAKRADVDSIRELKNYIYEESGVANRSLRALERIGYTEGAYGKAMEFLTTNYQSIKFPQAVAKRPTSDLINQALFLHRFMDMPTRKVREARRAQAAVERGLNLLRELGYNIPTDKERLSRIFKIIDKTGADITGDEKYQFIEYLDQAFDNGWTEEEIEMNILRWQSDDIVYSEMTSLFKERRNI